MTDAFTPQPGDKFSFGLWTVGNIGRDPFGDPVRAAQTPVRTLSGINLGTSGV